MTEWKKKTVLFLGSQAITLFGSSLVQFAMVWFVTLKTSSGFWVSMLTVCAYLPQFLISFAAGVWADRYSRKKLIIFADSSIAIATLCLALLMPFVREDTILLSLLLIISAIRSVGAGIQTPAVSAMVPQLVPEEHLMRFNGMNSTIQAIVQFAAPAAAGAILTISTLRSILFIDIVTAVVGIGVLYGIKLPTQARNANEQQTSVFKELIGGIKYAASDKFIGKLLILNGVFIFLCVPAGFLANLFVSRTYGDSYIYLTIVELVGFAGMMGGGILISIWGGFKNKVTTLVAGLVLFGVLAVGMGTVEVFIIYLIFMFIYGIAITMIQTATTTMLQEKSKPELQGRVFGLFGAIYSGFLPLGMLVFGPMADIVPLRWIMVGAGVALILIGVMMTVSREMKKQYSQISRSSS